MTASLTAAPTPRTPDRSDARPLVVVTRAAPDDSGLVERLAHDGFDALACPLQRRVPVDEDALAAAFEAQGPVDVLVLTSPHAADVAADVLGMGRLGEAQLIAPGAGTAARLADRSGGQARVQFPRSGGTSEDVLELPELASDRVAGRRVVILAAPGGRRLIADTLRGRGAEVVRLAPYLREAVAPSDALVAALDRKRPTITLLSSAAALAGLDRGLGAALRDRWLAGGFVVSSRRLADALRGLGAGQIEVADGASPDAMHRALTTLAAR
ncbi:uroporphyrinogen-III synthase [Halomonas denitrificans]|nr:uroporphyrinogen-III synthase [Halomonas denitrificans]